MNINSQDKSSWPKISVILPNRNMGPALEKTIQSIIAQDYPDYELIIIDNCSKDNSSEVIKKYEHHITYWVSEPDNGIYDGYNKGIKVATGDWLYFIGAGDDLLEQDVFRKMISKTDDADIVYGNCHWGRVGELHEEKYSKWRLIHKNMCHQTMFYRRELFTKLGLYETKYWVYADWIFNFKCWGNRQIKKKYIDEFVAFYEAHGNSHIYHAKDPFLKDKAMLLMQSFGVVYAGLYFLEYGYQRVWNITVRLLKRCLSKSQINFIRRIRQKAGS